MELIECEPSKKDATDSTIRWLDVTITGVGKMRDIWYGDRRDRVKWGALVHLARSQGLSKIVQVAFYQRLTDPKLLMDDVPISVPKEVWDHFSDLRNIEKLGESTGIEIVVLDRVFDSIRRREYIREVIQILRQHSASPKIVFLDPDTGIEPARAKAEHVTMEDVKEIWEVLSTRDWLAVYQHASRRGDWLEIGKQKFRQACEVEHVKVFRSCKIAKDVAVFAARRR